MTGLVFDNTNYPKLRRSRELIWEILSNMGEDNHFLQFRDIIPTDKLASLILDPAYKEKVSFFLLCGIKLLEEDFEMYTKESKDYSDSFLAHIYYVLGSRKIQSELTSHYVSSLFLK